MDAATTCTACKAPLSPGHEFFCPGCRRVLYYDWTTRFRPVRWKAERRVEYAAERLVGGKWVRLGGGK